MADRNFIELFIIRRQQLRISQAELAYRVGCHEKLISKWETRRVSPTTKFFLAWATALGFEVCIHAKA